MNRQGVTFSKSLGRLIQETIWYSICIFGWTIHWSGLSYIKHWHSDLHLNSTQYVTHWPQFGHVSSSYPIIERVYTPQHTAATAVPERLRNRSSFTKQSKMLYNAFLNISIDNSKSKGPDILQAKMEELVWWHFKQKHAKTKFVWS